MTPLGFTVASRKYHLTIKDILAFPVGETYRFFFLDRNMFDVSCDTKYNELNVPTKPSTFFRNGYYIDFTRREGIQGDWKWGFDSESSSIGEEFHVDMNTGWYPFRNNHVPIKDSQGIFTIPEDFAGKHYSELPEDTRIGWRGPMMLTENMDKCPDVTLNRDGYSN
jgi:hypothetical protein